MIRVESELRVEHMDVGTLGQSVGDFDRIDVTEVSRLQCSAPNRTLPGTAPDLKLRVGGKQPMALQSEAHSLTRKISISRHGTCSPECERLQRRR